MVNKYSQVFTHEHRSQQSMPTVNIERKETKGQTGSSTTMTTKGAQIEPYHHGAMRTQSLEDLMLKTR